MFETIKLCHLQMLGFRHYIHLQFCPGHFYYQALQKSKQEPIECKAPFDRTHSSKQKKEKTRAPHEGANAWLWGA